MNAKPSRESALIRTLVLSLLAATVSAPGESAPATRTALPVNGFSSVDFFVSPRGHDNWTGRSADPGTNDGPFATITRARDAVRALLKTERRGARVVLRGGTYYLDASLEYGPDDSGTEQAPVVYTVAPGEKVVLSGGRRMEGGRWGEANAHKAWVVDIPEVKESQWHFRQLFVNSERRPRTRLQPKLFLRAELVLERNFHSILGPKSL